jgi:hypothetical protein
MGIQPDGYDIYGYKYSDYRDYGTHKAELENNLPNQQSVKTNPYPTVSSGVLKMFYDMNE